MPVFKAVSIASCFCFAAHPSALTAEIVSITDMPDYAWYAGCFGTAAGNIMGYWDRHGFPNFYAGPTNGGLAPLNTVSNAPVRSWMKPYPRSQAPASLSRDRKRHGAVSSGDGIRR